MIKDNEFEMSAAQALTVTAASTKAPDLGKAGDAIGAGEQYVVVKVNTLFTTSDAATLAVAIETDDAVGFGTKATLLSVPVTAVSALTAGAVLLKAKLPVGVKRYIRAYYTVGTGSFTAGKIDAFLAPKVQVP